MTGTEFWHGGILTTNESSRWLPPAHTAGPQLSLFAWDRDKQILHGSTSAAEIST